VLAGHEVALAVGLRADGDQQRAALAQLRVEVAPGLEFGDAVRAPAPAKELDYQRAKGEQVRRADEATSCVVEGELRASAPAAGCGPRCTGEKLRDGALAYGKTLGLHQLACVGGNLVELVLKGGSGHSRTKQTK